MMSSGVNMLRCLLLLFLLSLSGAGGWRYTRRPRIGLQKIRQHIRLTPSVNKKIRKLIVSSHNYFRSRAVPSAEDMLIMTWDEHAAEKAQDWSDQCQQLRHTPPPGRYHKRFGSCGQNILISSHPVPWFFVVESWWLEHKLFNYDSANNDLSEVGHYTQLMWNSTHKVGCGFNRCRNEKNGHKYYSYVCNYCPAGNFRNRLGRPYTRGKPCTACNGQCHPRFGQLCTNSCNFADFWSNCEELEEAMQDTCYSRDWRGTKRWHISSANKTTEVRNNCGICNSPVHRHKCRATCKCKDKIFRHF